jgi:hypothetical protein
LATSWCVLMDADTFRGIPRACGVGAFSLHRLSHGTRRVEVTSSLMKLKGLPGRRLRRSTAGIRGRLTRRLSWSMRELSSPTARPMWTILPVGYIVELESVLPAWRDTIRSIPES